MKILKVIFYWCGLFGGLMLHAQHDIKKPPISTIHEVTTLERLWRLLPKLTKSDLVLFDIDKVLVVGKDTMHRATAAQRKNVRKPMNALQGPKRARVRTAAVLQRKRMLVDKKTPELIKRMQKKGVVVGALTRCYAGPFELIPRLEDCRIQELLGLGIDFSASFPTLVEHVFEELVYNDRHPLFKKGILFASHCDKGDVLRAFLRYRQWTPARIIFVDNSQENIIAVSQAAQTIGVPYIGFLYKAAYHIPGEFNEQLAQFQIRHLIDHEVVLDDDAAQELLQKEDGKTD